MKKIKLKTAILFLFIGLNTIAQSTFKKGYFIDTNGIKKEGVFMVFGEKMPDLISFKEKQNSEKVIQVKKTEIAEIKIEDLMFIRKNVTVELLDKNMFAIKGNNTETFNLESHSLLLKVLFKYNNLTLYLYNHNKNDYFFIESKDNIEFLKYKKVKINGKNAKVRKFVMQIKKN